jgi:hypothetical protein
MAAMPGMLQCKCGGQASDGPSNDDERESSMRIYLARHRSDMLLARRRRERKRPRGCAGGVGDLRGLTMPGRTTCDECSKV